MEDHEKIYKTLSRSGGIGITLGIITIVTGVVTGILMIVTGARLLTKRGDIMF